MDDRLERREFLKKVATVTTAPAIATAVAHGAIPSEKTIGLTNTIPVRVFGRTGAKLPILGYGGAALPQAWGNPLSLEDRVNLVRHAYESGLRYFDTAGNYLESQSILGEALKDVRDNVHLVSKVETTVPPFVRKAVEKSLKELQTDYLDGIQIHGTPGLEQMSVDKAMKIHGELLKLRDEGVVRFIGFSAHSYFDKALSLISSGGFDHCMLSYGYIPRGYDQILSTRMVALRDACVAKADELGMGIIAMKVIGAGLLGARSAYVVPSFAEEHRKRLPGAAIRYVLQDRRIHLLDIGMRSKEEIDANIDILSVDTTYTKEDRALLAEFCARAYDSDTMKTMRVD